MGFILAVDSALTMGLQPDGQPARGHVDSRYGVATRIVAGLVRRAKMMVPSPSVALYRTGVTIEKLSDDVTDDSTAIELLSQRNVLVGQSNTGRFLDKITTDLKPNCSDHVIVLTDACCYDGDLNFFAPCETRFVIVNMNKEGRDPTQIEELEEISAESCGYDVAPQNEEFYHLFYYNTTVEAIVEKIAGEMFVIPVYKLKLGNLTGVITNSPPIWEDRPFEIEIIGFCRAWNLLNAPVETTHHILPKSETGDDQEEAIESPHLLSLLMECMNPDLTAVCRFGSGRFGVISPMEAEGTRNLILSMLPMSEDIPAYIPALEQVTIGPHHYTHDQRDEHRGDLHVPERADEAASYARNAQSWISECGIAGDVQKIIRYLKKLPERRDPFYSEVNKVRYYASVITCHSVCVETARIILEEAEGLNEIAKKHAEYVAEKLREDLGTMDGAILDIPPLDI